MHKEAAKNEPTTFEDYFSKKETETSKEKKIIEKNSSFTNLNQNRSSPVKDDIDEISSVFENKRRMRPPLKDSKD